MYLYEFLFVFLQKKTFPEYLSDNRQNRARNFLLTFFKICYYLKIK